MHFPAGREDPTPISFLYVQSNFFFFQSRMILSFKVRNSSRNILEAPSGLKFGNNDVMFKGLASGQIACIHLNVHYIIKYFFQYFSSVDLKRNIRVMNQLNPICAFLLVVIKHLYFVEIPLPFIQRMPIITSNHIHSR